MTSIKELCLDAIPAAQTGVPVIVSPQVALGIFFICFHALGQAAKPKVFGLEKEQSWNLKARSKD